MSKVAEVAQGIVSGKIKLIEGLVQEALDEGNAPVDILNQGMIDAMTTVGERFKNNEIFVPEMLVSAKTMKKGLAILKPHLSGDQDRKIGKMIMGTVAGDLHDIGKNLVIMMIESTGYEVVDLGIDVPVSAFMEAANDPEVTVVGASALLTTTMPALQETVEALNKHPRRGEFKVMVGGAPVSQAFADQIGADVYTADAASAGQAAKALAKA